VEFLKGRPCERASKEPPLRFSPAASAA